MKTLIALLSAIVIFNSCTDRKKIGTCEKSEHVKFRNVHFKFPLKAQDAYNLSSRNISFLSDSQMRADSLVDGGRVSWFFDAFPSKVSPNDTVNFLKDSRVYGVTFYLYGDYAVLDGEIIKEFKKDYFDEFVYKNVANPYYIYSKGCLSIIVKRIAMDTKLIPTVSFCYGLTEDQKELYANDLGRVLK